MNYPQLFFDGQLVYIKNELTKNKEVLVKVIGFNSKNAIYYVQELPNILKGKTVGDIYSLPIEDMYLKSDSDEK